MDVGAGSPPPSISPRLTTLPRARPHTSLRKMRAHRMTTPERARIGILTVSDRASRGEYQDLGGPAIRDCLTEILSSPWEAVARVIPDEQPLIEATLRELCDNEGCGLVVTTGG